MHARPSVLRRAAGAAGIAALAAASALGAATAAVAEPAAGGPQLEVTPTEGLSPGQGITVTGSGLDPESGYYVATCVTGTTGPAGPDCAGDRAVPGSQLWVSNGRGATTPIAPDGTFTAELNAVATGTTMTGTEVDCTASDCAVALFYDHRNGFGTVAETPVSFTGAAGGAPADAAGAAEGAEQAEAAESQAASEAESDDDGSAAVWWGVGGGAVALFVIGGIVYAVRARGKGA